MEVVIGCQGESTPVEVWKRFFFFFSFELGIVGLKEKL